ncbi:nonsense-mediated mRNA decay factor SMG7-like isoform X1 [Euwallacea fornicatus]|uniref:nonsense-mediated mRNA decay factor SMG7-like isoform X1 n=1 Tax=Euwallacea fornicatus TaxID=995702 RepID=UPI00338F9E09
MGYKAAIQILKQAEELKLKVLKKSDLLNDSEIWKNQQQLQNIYHEVLVLDLEYALDKKVELDLWNIGFKNHITDLQEKTRDKKNSRRSDFQALLTWTLESASGFYLSLLEELCNAFDIDLPFRRRGIIYGQQTVNNDQATIPQIASCSYICQYCLVHLGDIARYRNQRRQAESFYKQAILVSPHSGHPYNQLALLEASQGDKLSTVFYYIRATCVKIPFPASTTNLVNVLSSAIDKEGTIEKIQTKMTVNEYIQLFLCAHGHFQTMLDIKQAQLAVKSLNSVMTALVATQSFKTKELIKISVINLYAFTYLGRDKELTDDEVKIKDLILQLIAGSLSAFLMPIYTLQNEESLLEYYALPAVKILMYFLTNKPDTLKCKVFKERMQIWPSLCKLVNSAQSLLIGFNYNKFSKSSLLEDRHLQGFLPLEKNLKELNFNVDIDDCEVESKVRMRRIVDFAKWLCDHDLDGVKLITKTENKGVINFEAVLSQPDPTNELLEEMKSFTIQEPKDDKSTITSFDKKAGILKPQGSLEKSREEREVKSVNTGGDVTLKLYDSVKSKRAKHNVVLQSIFKKMEESKQVKFNVEESEVKDKTVKFEALKASIPQIPPKQQPNNQFSNNQPVRTQSFNQNHLAFPPQPLPFQQQQQQSQPPNDYLTNLRNLGKGVDNMMPQFSKNGPYSNPNMLPPQQPPVKFPPSFNIPPPHFNTWGREDLKLPPSGPHNSWWGTFNQPSNPNFANQAQNPYGEVKPNFSGFSNPPNQSFVAQRPPEPSNYNTMSFPHNIQPMQYNINQQQMVKVGPQNNSNRAPYDPFGSAWSVNRNFGDETGPQSSMSMRQAMLKEGTLPGGRQGMQEMPPQSPGAYSLFNNTSWAPSVPNHPRGNKMADNVGFNGPQHSLFGGPGPQSLAQLLEYQQNQMGPNVRGNGATHNQDT